jgi:hypothetical protein
MKLLPGREPWQQVLSFLLYGMTTIHKLIAGAIEDLQEFLEQQNVPPTHNEVSDTIHEIADGRVPVYNYDLLAVAQSCLWLAIEEPEL